VTIAQLDAGVDEIGQSPKNTGTLDLIVRRPGVGERELVDQGELDLVEGLVGDNWSTRATDGAPDPDRQLTIMNTRVISLLAPDKKDWGLAGDQLFMEMDLSVENLSPGTRLSVGSAVVEVSAPPHTGCRKFVERFGLDAVKWVNSPVGRALNLRGINAKVVQSGVIRTGDVVTKK
jgi:MOSC domain-containing protein YiiM